MKKLGKLKLNEFTQMSNAEMKSIRGGTTFNCTRSKGSESDSWSTDNESGAGQWAGFWQSAGWTAGCTYETPNPLYDPTNPYVSYYLA